jgi:Zn-dependent protease with chaperone function
VMNWYGGHEVKSDRAPGAFSVLEDLANAAGCPCPRLFVTTAMWPNGFAVADRRGRFVVITEGAFDLLTAAELKGLLALLVAMSARPSLRRETVCATLAMICAPLLLPGVVRWVLPKKRWFAIDARAVQLSGVDAVASALRALDSKGTQTVTSAAGALFCLGPRRNGERLDGRWATHPPIEARLAAMGRGSSTSLSAVESG